MNADEMTMVVALETSILVLHVSVVASMVID